VGYTDDLNGLNELNVERLPSGESMKFFTTFVGKVFPLSGREIHTRRKNTGDRRQNKNLKAKR